MAKVRTKAGVAPAKPARARRAGAASVAGKKPASTNQPLIRALMDGRGVIVLDRVVDRLGMTKQQFGRMIGVSAETLQKKARAESRKTQARVKEAIEIIDRVRAWAGGEAQATAWYKSQPIPAFGGRTAESLIKSGQAPALRDYLDHLAMGGFA